MNSILIVIGQIHICIGYRGTVFVVYSNDQTISLYVLCPRTGTWSYDMVPDDGMGIVGGMVCVVCGSNDRTLSPAASSRVRRARPGSTTHTQILCGAPTSPCTSCSRAWLRPRKVSFFNHTWYLSFVLHGQNFWRIKFTLKNANFSR